MSKQTITINGMSCASCAARIEKEVGELEGISKASVNIAAEKLSVEYDEQQISIQNAKDAVTIGYSVPDEVIPLQVAIYASKNSCYIIQVYQKTA